MITNTVLRIHVVFIILFTSYVQLNHCFFGKTIIIPQSETVDAAREIAGWQQHINDYNVGRAYWSFYMAPAYKQSWNNQQLVNFLLGGNDCFVVQGSQVTGGRMQGALLADYFGLPYDFNSSVRLRPRIANFVWDMSLYIGFDNWCPGWYLRIHAPLVHTKWDLHLEESVIVSGTQGYPAGYMGPDAIERSALAPNFTQAISGSFCNQFNQCVPLVWGDMQNPLRYGTIQGRRNATRLSDVHFIVGYNFINQLNAHAGCNVRISAPAGSHPDAQYFFGPVIGNGHHPELGIGFTSHILYNVEKNAGFWCDVNVTHMFADTQLRSFDFCSGAGSRYMLLSKIAPANNTDVIIDGSAVTQQYIGQLSPAINYTTLEAKISMPVQVNLVAKWSAEVSGVQLDVGYGLWYRSAEQLKERSCFPSCYAFKGDAQLYGFVSVAAGDLTINQPLALNVTQDQATLCSGQKSTNFVSGVAYTNANADNPALAFDSNNNLLYQLNSTDSATLGIAQQQINGSNPPILLTDADIDICSSLNPRALSHKVFANVAHAWEHEDMCIVPFLAIGSEFEWRCGCFRTNSAISLWGVWAKWGLSF